VTESEVRRWWEGRWFAAALVLATAIPLLWPNIPPLVDLPGHLGRYHVQLTIDDNSALQRFYHFQWALIGNLGVDLLVVPLAKLFGLELAVKLIVLLIPTMTAGGLIWTAREVHGRIPPTALFALPLAYNFPFMFGFINFGLSMGLALLAFAFWLRLARLGRLRLRAALFVPISILIWVTHAFGWGTLGVMAFSAELVRQVDMRRPLLTAGFKTALHCLALAPPVLLMLLWRSGEQVSGQTGDWFNWARKLDWVLMVLRDRWQWFDLASLAVIAIVLALGLAYRKLEYSRNLAASALFLALCFVFLPRIIFGSAYADMRLAPYVLAVAVIAIRFRPAHVAGAGAAIAMAGALFFAARTAATTLSFWMYDKSYDRELQALARVPRDARLLSFVGVHCKKPWTMSRLEHLPALALVRRNAFSNDQWSMSGAQLLTVRYRDGRGYAQDPSQQVLQHRCRGEGWRTIDQSLRGFPRHAFDYVWLIQPPSYDPASAAGLEPVWRSGTSMVYRVTRAPAAAPSTETP
jgi:hypothetical protein